MPDNTIIDLNHNVVLQGDRFVFITGFGLADFKAITQYPNGLFQGFVRTNDGHKNSEWRFENYCFASHQIFTTREDAVNHID